MTILTKPEEAKCVIVWNDSDIDEEGDEFLRYFVAYANDEGDFTGDFIQCDNKDAALTCAFALAKENNWDTIEDDCLLLD